MSFISEKQQEKDLRQLAETLGLTMGSIIPAIVQYPPKSPEEAKVTVEALNAVLESSIAHGAPPNATAFFKAFITAIDHYAGH